MSKKRDVSVLVSAIGWTGSFMSELVVALRDRSVPDEVIHAFVTTGGKASIGKIADVLANDLATPMAVAPAQTVGRFLATIKLGTCKTPDNLRRVINSSTKPKRKISTYADQILSKVVVNPQEIEVDLWEVTGVDLGFTEAATREAIYARAMELGFTKCPAEVGARLRIQSDDGTWRVIATDPLADSDGRLRLFSVRGADVDLWLDTFCDRPGDLWVPDDRWVWVWPRRK